MTYTRHTKIDTNGHRKSPDVKPSVPHLLVALNWILSSILRLSQIIYCLYILYPLVNIHIAMEKSPCLMGKLTTNGHFNSYVNGYQRVYFIKYPMQWLVSYTQQPPRLAGQGPMSEDPKNSQCGYGPENVGYTPNEIAI